MFQENANRKSAEFIREKDCRADVLATAREEMSAEDAQMDLGFLSNWTLDEYRCECAGMMDATRFVSMTIDGRNQVVYNQNFFELDAALRARKRCWAVLSR